MKIDELTGQKIIIKFPMKLAKTSQEVHKILSTVYGDNALNKKVLFKWIKCFCESREDCKDNVRPGNPSATFGDQNIKRVWSLLLFDQKMTVQMLADMLSIGKLSLYMILIEN